MVYSHLEKLGQLFYEEGENVTMWLYRYFRGVVVFIDVNTCDDVIPFSCIPRSFTCTRLGRL